MTWINIGQVDSQIIFKTSEVLSSTCILDDPDFLIASPS